MVIDDGPIDEDTTTTAEGANDVGESSQRAVGPMDRFTMPMDPTSLSNTKVSRQQKISEAIWKERMHKLKRYIAKWVYVHGNKLFH